MIFEILVSYFFSITFLSISDHHIPHNKVTRARCLCISRRRKLFETPDFIALRANVRFFRGTLRDTGLLLSSLTSFVASTRLNRSRVGAIESPDHSRQVFDQYDTCEVPEKFSWATF